jgi:hypothetical protein
MAQQDNLDPQMDNQDPQDNTAVADWHSALPEDIRNHPAATKFKTPADVVKSYIELEKFVGKDKIPLPGKDAKPEDWDVVWSRLGRPESPDKYTLPKLDNMPANFPQVAPEKMKEFLGVAHKAGLLPSQVSEVYSWFMKDTVNAIGQAESARAEGMVKAEAALRHEWGKAYDQNVGTARKVLQTYGSDEIFQLMDSGLGNDPRVIKLFAEIGKRMSEDKLIGDHAQLTKSPDEANREIAKILSQPKHAYFDLMNPEHDFAVAQMKELFEQAHPEEPKQ